MLHRNLLRAGGNVYDIHAFEATGNSTMEVSTSVDDVNVLAVGGGAGGSGRHGGGGGAGGLVFVPKAVASLTPGTKTVTVGSGGLGPTDDSDNGTDRQGSPSTVPVSGETVAALGGGRPGNQTNNTEGFDGGSGGGGNYGGNKGDLRAGGQGLQPGETGLSGAPYGYGTDGGDHYMADNGNTSYAGGGGGGAGEPGVDWRSDQGDIDGVRGGDGLTSVTINSDTHRFVDIFTDLFGEVVNGDPFFAGGGASGNWQQGEPVRPDGGGDGGGGNGGFADGQEPSDGEDAMPNTGGGGGGAGGADKNHKAGDGGSGIVLIRAPQGTITGGDTVVTVETDNTGKIQTVL